MLFSINILRCNVRMGEKCLDGGILLTRERRCAGILNESKGRRIPLPTGERSGVRGINVREKSSDLSK